MANFASFIFVCFCVVSFMSCDRADQKSDGLYDTDIISEARSMNDVGIPLDTLEKKVFENGDTLAYDQLMIELMDYPIEERVKCSKRMAEKYQYIQAYKDYAQMMFMKCNHDRRDLSKNEKDTIILFLSIAVARGDSAAIELKREYGFK